MQGKLCFCGSRQRRAASGVSIRSPCSGRRSRFLENYKIEVDVEFSACKSFFEVLWLLEATLLPCVTVPLVPQARGGCVLLPGVSKISDSGDFTD